MSVSLQVVMEDVEKKKHAKDPFQEKYVQYVTSPFFSAERVNQASNEVIEEATVHVQTRLELIHQMNKALQKQLQSVISENDSMGKRKRKRAERKNTTGKIDNRVSSQQEWMNINCQHTYETFQKLNDKKYKGPPVIVLDEEDMEFPYCVQTNSLQFKFRDTFEPEGVSHSKRSFYVDKVLIEEDSGAMLLNPSWKRLLNEGNVGEKREILDDENLLNDIIETFDSSSLIDCIDLQIDEVENSFETTVENMDDLSSGEEYNDSTDTFSRQGIAGEGEEQLDKLENEDHLKTSASTVRTQPRRMENEVPKPNEQLLASDQSRILRDDRRPYLVIDMTKPISMPKEKRSVGVLKLKSSEEENYITWDKLKQISSSPTKSLIKKFRESLLSIKILCDSEYRKSLFWTNKEDMYQLRQVLRATPIYQQERTKTIYETEELIDEETDKKPNSVEPIMTPVRQQQQKTNIRQGSSTNFFQELYNSLPSTNYSRRNRIGISKISSYMSEELERTITLNSEAKLSQITDAISLKHFSSQSDVTSSDVTPQRYFMALIHLATKKSSLVLEKKENEILIRQS